MRRSPEVETRRRTQRRSVSSQNRWVRLRVSTAGLRRIDKLGVEAVLAEIKAKSKARA